MTEKTEMRAKLFRNGGSQAVRLPKEFQFVGTEVRIRRSGHGVLLEPVGPQVTASDVASARKVMEAIDSRGSGIVGEALRKLQEAGGDK